MPHFQKKISAISLWDLFMDSEFGGSRAVAKNQFILQQQHRLSQSHRRHQNDSSQLDRVNLDDFEVEEDDALPEFPCPHCYEEFDLASLCSHLEDEHSCESKATTCPVCSVRVAGDMINHIILVHGHLFKRRRRLRRPTIPNSRALSLLGKDLREAHLQALLGGSGYRSNNITTSNTAPDPLLSSLLNFSASETEDISMSVISSIDADISKSMELRHRWKSSFDSSLSHEEREERARQAAGRAVFIQDMLASTLLVDW